MIGLMIETLVPQSRAEVDVITYRCADTESNCPICDGDVRVETGFNVVRFGDCEVQVPAYQMRCMGCDSVLEMHAAN